MLRILRQEGKGYTIHTRFHTGRWFATSTVKTSGYNTAILEFIRPVSLDKILELSGFMELPFPHKIIIFGEVSGVDYTIHMIPQSDVETKVECLVGNEVIIPYEKASFIDSQLIEYCSVKVEDYIKKNLLTGVNSKK